MAGYAHGLVKKVDLPARAIMEKHRNPAAILADTSITYDSYAAGELFQARDMSVLELADASETEPHFMGADDAKFYEGGQNFSTRPRLQAALTRRSWQGGTILSDGKVSYQYIVLSIMIPDMHGLVPFGDPSADHYGYNETPGTTDMATAIQLCLDNHGACLLHADEYAVGTTITKDNCCIRGAGADGNFTKITGLSGSIPIGDAILRIGRSSVLRGFRVGYDTLTGTEWRGQRVGLDTRGADYVLQRGSVVTEIAFDNVGSAIHDFDDPVFSVTFGTLRVMAHSFSGVDLISTGGTGNVWGNVYINGGHEYTPYYGFHIAQRMAGTITLLNVEHGVYSTAAVSFDGAVEVNVGKIHMEGTDIAAGATFVQINETNIIASQITFLNCLVSGDNCALFDLLDTGEPLVNNHENDGNLLQIGSLQAQGLSRPNNGLYPDYPDSQRGVDNLTGFKFFRREGYDNKLYKLQINHVQWGDYSGTVEEADTLRHALTRHSDTDYIDVLQYQSRGRLVHPNKNVVANGAMTDWELTTDTASSGNPVEVATDWIGNSATGSMDVGQVALPIGSDTEFGLRLDNSAGIGTYQHLTHRIYDYKPLIGKRLTLGFWMMAGAAGRVLEQISFTLQNAGGAPTSEYVQVISGASVRLDAVTEWQYYEFTFDAVADADITTYGSGPYFELKFAINDASADRTAVIDLKQIKIEACEEGSDFTDDVLSNAHITEIGSNSNGHYEITPEGLVTATKHFGVAATSHAWTFPVEVATVTGGSFALSAMARGSGAPAIVTENYDATTTGVTLNVWDASGAALAQQVYATMKGKEA